MLSTRSQFLKHLFRPLVCNACGKIVREGKKVARVVKQEAKAERKAVEVAIRELAELQKMQREAVKEEAKAYAAHARTLRKFHKEELTFFAARARFERAQAGLQVYIAISSSALACVSSCGKMMLSMHICYPRK